MLLIPDPGKLSQADALQVKEWLESIDLGKIQVPKNFYWYGLAYHAGFQARNFSENNFNNNNLIWAKIAVNIYGKLAEYYPNIEDLRVAMMLRAYLITRVGYDIDPEFLNVDSIIAWFFDTLEMPYEAAEKTAEFLEKNHKNIEKIIEAIDDIRKLKKIQSRLKVILFLVEHDKIKISKELEVWLALSKKVS